MGHTLKILPNDYSNMEAIYIKQQTTYINGDKATWPSYHKISVEGKITSISMYRRTVSYPKTLCLQKGFQIISEDEFIKAKSLIENQ